MSRDSVYLIHSERPLIERLSAVLVQSVDQRLELQSHLVAGPDGREEVGAV